MSAFAWLVPALTAVSGVIILLFGKRLPGGGAPVGIATVGIGFLLSLGIAIEVFGGNIAAVAEHGAAFLTERQVELAPMGGNEILPAGIRVDGLTAMMFLLVTFVSLMVQIYSMGYMHGDSRYTWFFSLLSFFTFAMLLLVVSDNLLQLMIGWELVGICSYLLISFWWEERINTNAGIKALLTTHFADIGLMVGVIALWSQFRTFDISTMVSSVEAGEYNPQLLTISLLALFLGAVGKSAQFPLSTWLPDAMAGPTPVSALIHAATMVTAGVFLIARLYPLYEASPTAMTVIAVIGAITLFAAGLLALVQDDVKRVLAYSTVSQLGYMVAALAFSYTAGIFHLFTHGFFKALLFLGAGSLIHAVHSNNMSDMGGLRKPMPVTFTTFVIGSAALAAIPPLAGFWSKDEVLAGALGEGGYTGWLVALLGAFGGLITAFYMARVLWLVFAGEFRGHGHPHESPPSMKWPLIILAVPAALIGFINLPFEFAHPYGFAAWTMFSFEYFEGHPAEFNFGMAIAATLLAVGGVLVGSAIYRRREAVARDPMLRMGPLTGVLQNGYYLDRLYTDLLVRTVALRLLAPAAYWLNQHVLDAIVNFAGRLALGAGDVTYNAVDQRGIDGAVNGVGRSMNFTGYVVKFAQSGNVQLYAGAMFVGVFVLGVLFALA